MQADGFTDVESARQFLVRSLSRANRHLYAVNSKLKIRRPMGTTATIGVLWNNQLTIANIGDSRCYRIRKRKITQLTSDQNWMTEMVRSGRLSAADAAIHPLSKTLTNCIGAIENLTMELQTTTVLEGDRFLFCTDGVYSMIEDDQIFKEIRDAETPVESAKRMMHLSLRRGGLDNISAVCLHT